MELIVLLAGASVVLFSIYQAKRMRSAMNASMDDNACVACDSTSLQLFGADVYRCSDCGYEGGSGLARHQEEKKKESYAAMSLTERREGARRDLSEAWTLLTAVEGTMNSVLSSSRADIIGMSGGDSGQRKQQELTSAMGEILRAQNCIKDAAAKLGKKSADVPDLDIDFSSPAFALDVSFDNIFSDLKVHGKIKEINQHVQAMQGAVREALAKLQGGVSPA